MTSIEWVRSEDGSPGVTWNPVRGCSRVSPGCENCYAERQGHRFGGPGQLYAGLTKLGKKGPQWTGKVRFVPEKLGDPLRWRRPRRVFVNSMSDLFHESFSNEQIAAVFGVMAAASQHTFQVLTKRPVRMRDWFEWATRTAVNVNAGRGMSEAWLGLCLAQRLAPESKALTNVCNVVAKAPWPLPNVHLGVSVEDQATADKRIPLLLDTPAAVRFVSAEPLLGEVDLAPYLRRHAVNEEGDCASWCSACDIRDRKGIALDASVDWVIVGGESGHGARPCDVEWIRDIVRQCRDADAPVFVKQIGSTPHIGDGGAGMARFLTGDRGAHWRMDDESTDPITVYEIRNRKGADMAEWPADIRIREFPEVKA